MMKESKIFPAEEPVELEDDDVIDTELKDVELQIRGQYTKNGDGLHKDDTSDNLPRRFRRIHIIVGLLVIALILFIVGFTTGIEAEEVEEEIQAKRAKNDEKKINHDVKPDDVVEPGDVGEPDDVVDPGGAGEPDAVGELGDNEPTPPYSCAATNVICETDNMNAWNKLDTYALGTDQQDYAGFAVSLSCDGSIMAVGAPRGDTLFTNAGHVRVYEMDKSTKKWKQIGQDIEGENMRDQFGSSLSLSGDGLRLAIGSRFNDNKAENAGHVRIFEFERLMNSWLHIGTIEGEGGGDQSGHSVSLSEDGNRVAIGAPANNATGVEAGHARVFEFTLDSEENIEWKQMGQDLDGVASGDKAGRAVSLSGDGNRVAVGSYSNDGLNSYQKDVGHVRVFEYVSSTNTWVMLGEEIVGYEPGDWFGLSLSLSYDGSIIAIGAPGDHSNFWPGSTSVFRYDGSAWAQHGKMILDGGYSVDITGDGKRVVSGSYKANENGMNSGFTAVWEFNETDWNIVGDFIHGNVGELSGSSVAISNDGMRIISSSPAYDFNGTAEVGLVRTYDLC